MPNTITEFCRAEESLREHARQVVKLAERTLTAMYPHSAYVWLDGDAPEDDDYAALRLIAVLDEHGGVHHRFDDAEKLPAVPPSIDSAWGRQDCRSPETIRVFLHSALKAGVDFDDLPEQAAYQHGEHWCIPVLRLGEGT